MAYGYNGKILHVNLSDGTFKIEEPEDKFYRRYGGGSAMGTYYLLKEMPAGIDPLGPKNMLCIFVSPTTGAPVSGQSRVSMVAKSPLTEGIGDSQAGGFWPALFKRTGFDGVVISGRAEKPVYLYIQDGEAEIRSAEHLWGKITGESEAILKEELGERNLEVMQIGPAGENQVLFANVINMSNRANGRNGMGAVFGSKNLKAIAVKGNLKQEWHDPGALKELAQWGAQHFEDSDVHDLGIYGTANVLGAQQGLGGLPNYNWNSGSFDSYEKLTGPTMKDTILVERDTCYACTVRCKRVVEVKEEDLQVDPHYGGPEYETIASFGAYCGVDDLKAISKANEICNKYGMDTISCGATIAWAMDCFEEGILSVEDTGGMELHFGDAKTVVNLTEMIGKREGFGDFLADGSARAAGKLGPEAEELVVAVKKQELPAHMPEAKRSLALIYSVNPYGADHQSHEHDTSFSTEFSYDERMAEIGLLDPQPPRALNAQKVRYSMYTQWVYNACNSFTVCQFVYGPAWHLYSTQQFVDLIRAATGWNFSLFELLKIGERTVNLQRAFNAREGFKKADDQLPKKLFKPKKGGPTDGVSITKGQIETAITTYYQMAGWDREGRPTPAKLQELGIGWVAEVL
ncbi:MAG: aldehyde ferredoxin oxidoreductase family protein [Anaerolineales bacterium]